MTKKLLLVLLLLVSIKTFAQDKKWSVEANYPVATGEGFIDDTKGIIDIGFKYRFADFGFMKLGAGLNAGLFSNSSVSEFGNAESQNNIFEAKTKNYLLQPKVFTEFSIPAIKKLKPFIGLGYTVIVNDNSIAITGEPTRESNRTNGGFNLNAGISYDLTKNLFLQVQYDYINQRIIEKSIDFKTNRVIDIVKIGVGFRF